MINYNRYEPDYNDLAFDPKNSKPCYDIEKLKTKIAIYERALVVIENEAAMRGERDIFEIAGQALKQAGARRE